MHEREKALAAAAPFPTVLAQLERADLDGAPQIEPLGIVFAALRGDQRLDPVMDALVPLQRAHPHAHVEDAARAVLALAGAGLGLVLIPPTNVAGLAAGVGLRVEDLIAEGEQSMGFLPSSPARAGLGVDASYRWDVYHEEPVRSPQELGWRELLGYKVAFTDGRARCEAALRAAHGDPHAVASRRRYGTVFVDAADREAFALEWYAEEPDWAAPACDARARAHALGALGDSLRDGTPLPIPPPTSGIIAAGNGEYEFRPPIGALELIRAIGAPQAFARTIDVHMSSWRLATKDGLLRIGDRQVAALLEGQPAGEPVPGISLPAASARVLGPADVVRHLRVFVTGEPAR